MIVNNFNQLLRLVRETLKSGKSIAIIGWRDSNHNRFTRHLPTKKIIFLEASAASIPERVNFVLFTRFVTHEEAKRAKSNRSCHPIPVEIGRIKRILELCADLLISSPSNQIVTGAEKPVAVEPISTPNPIDELDDDVLDFLTTSTPKEKCEMDNMEKFAETFLAMANANIRKPGHVGKTSLGKMRRDLGIEESTPTLISGCWIIGVIEEGNSKTGWYKAGPKILATATQEDSEPENGYELAKYLVAKKPEVLAQQAEIEKEYLAQKAEIEIMLARIERAEKVLAAVAEMK